MYFMNECAFLICVCQAQRYAHRYNIEYENVDGSKSELNLQNYCSELNIVHTGGIRYAETNFIILGINA